MMYLTSMASTVQEVLNHSFYNKTPGPNEGYEDELEAINAKSTNLPIAYPDGDRVSNLKGKGSSLLDIYTTLIALDGRLALGRD